MASESDQYAAVDYTKKTHRDSDDTGDLEDDTSVEYINYDDHFHDNDDEDEDGPPLPGRGYNG